ncbi:hypothetical protein JOF46_000865 [Paeniglutamicibacter psychrophenolicus]|uniref:Uncharacterized protein n=1 Tax=Paeniglutamicibacter psychrophenolicus TaxID=257454 RepID=A0ABS4WAL1_9MICC|nr:hypothetical protein [Paeniglutamicibacter psychrophenolicus]
MTIALFTPRPNPSRVTRDRVLHAVIGEINVGADSNDDSPSPSLKRAIIGCIQKVASSTFLFSVFRGCSRRFDESIVHEVPRPNSLLEVIKLDRTDESIDVFDNENFRLQDSYDPNELLPKFVALNADLIAVKARKPLARRATDDNVDFVGFPFWFPTNYVPTENLWWVKAVGTIRLSSEVHGI